MFSNDKCSFRIRRVDAEFLSRQGAEVTLIVPREKAGFWKKSGNDSREFRIMESPGLFPSRFRRGGFSVMDLLFKCAYAAFGKYDVIHCTCGHRPANLLPSLIARKLRSKATVDEWWEWYGEEGRGRARLGFFARFLQWYDNKLELPTKASFSHVIAISSALKRRLLPEVQSHVSVLNGPVDSASMKPMERDAARAHTGIATQYFVIGATAVGRAEHDDTLPLLEAALHLQQSHPDLRVFLTGEKSYIEELQEGKFGSLIIYKGWLSFEDYAAHLSACDAFALPLCDTPRNQGRWPHKLGDFFHLARPTIASPVGDVGPVFEENRLGVLADCSAESMASALRILLDSRESLDTLCADAPRVSRALSDERRADFLFALYRDLASSKK